jgi:hypothetical protein
LLYEQIGLLPMLLLVLYISILSVLEKVSHVLAAYPVYVRKVTIKPEATAARTPNVNDLSDISSSPRTMHEV